MSFDGSVKVLGLRFVAVISVLYLKCDTSPVALLISFCLCFPPLVARKRWADGSFEGCDGQDGEQMTSFMSSYLLADGAAWEEGRPVKMRLWSAGENLLLRKVCLQINTENKNISKRSFGCIRLVDFGLNLSWQQNSLPQWFYTSQRPPVSQTVWAELWRILISNCCCYWWKQACITSCLPGNVLYWRATLLLRIAPDLRKLNQICITR